MKPTIKLLAHQKLLTLLTTLLILIESLGKVTSSLTLAPLTDQLINKNFRGVVFWLLATISIWGVTLTIAYVNSLLKAQIIRKVTNFEPISRTGSPVFRFMNIIRSTTMNMSRG